MKLFRSLLLVGLSVVGVVFARDIERGYMSREKRLTCADLVDQAATQLQELSAMIQKRRNFMQVARFATKADSDGFRADVTKEIKDRLQQVKTLINKAEKEAHVAL